VSYTRPTFDELLARIQVDLELVPAVIREPLAAAWSRACHGQYGYLSWINLQCSPLTCDLDRLYEWASLYAVARLDATQAVGAALATGADGSQVLVDTLFRGANGLDYAAREAVTVVDGVARVPVRCTTRGPAGNLSSGQELTLVDPIIGMANAATVTTGGIAGGADVELLDDWRMRVADEWQATVVRGGRGGRARSAHPSVTGALVQLHALGLGTVLVRPLCGNLVNRMPTQAVLDAVAAFIEERAPFGAEPHVAMPILQPVGIHLHLPPAVDSIAVRTAIGAALFSLVARKMAEAAVLTPTEIDSAVGNVTSQFVRVLPLVDIAAAPGEILATPVVSWV
jgi:uncharacterized phage protein gp47/JayE